MAPKTSGDRPRLPLGSPLDSRFGAVNTDSRVINGYLEKDASGQLQLVKRPGMTQYNGSLSPPVGSAAVGQFLAFSGGLFSYVLSFYFQSGSPSTISIISGGGSPVATINTTSLRSYPVVAAQYLDDKVAINVGGQSVTGFTVSTNATTTNAITGITSILVPGIVVLDGTTYVMDQTATIWGSGIGNVTFSGNFSQAISEAGGGVFLAKQGNYVVAMKTLSTEFFYDAANPTGNPISPARGMEFKWGCMDARTVQDVDDTLFWMAQSRQGTVFVAMMKNFKATRISPPWVDRLLEEGNILNFAYNLYSFSFKHSGHSFYGITVDIPGTPTGSFLYQTLVYDITENQWYLWANGAGTRFPFVYSISIPTGLDVFQNIDNNTVLVYADDTNGTDLGTVFTCEAYTPNVDLDTRRRKILSRMDFICDQQPAFLQIRHSEDDFKTYSAFRSVDMNQKRPTLVDCGSFRRRTWNIRHTAPYPMRLQAVELELEIGS